MNNAEHSTMAQNGSKGLTSENEFFWIKKFGIQYCAPVRVYIQKSNIVAHSERFKENNSLQL